MIFKMSKHRNLALNGLFISKQLVFSSLHHGIFLYIAACCMLHCSMYLSEYIIQLFIFILTVELRKGEVGTNISII